MYMLYVFIGTDYKKSTDKAQVCVDRLLQKEPFATHITLNSESVADVDFSDVLATQGLFKSKMIVTLTGIFSSPEAERCLEYLEHFAQSEHIVIVVDGVLKATEKKLLQKHAHTLVESSSGDTPESYNPFALTDALYARDAKQLFVHIEEARMRGDEVESLAGLVHWAAKAMLIAAGSESPASAGLKPFVYNKARAGSKQWGAVLPELVQESGYALHRARMQGRDGYDELSRVLLKLCA